MRKKSKINKRTKSSILYDDELDDFEEWEPLIKLRENEDYPGLVRYCKQRAERYSDDPYSQFYLGEAYFLNGEYEKAINFLKEHHRKQPDNFDFHYVILDSLFALGKNEDDFDWIMKPVILRMSNEILNNCYEFLKPKRKPRTISELYRIHYERLFAFHRGRPIKRIGAR